MTDNEPLVQTKELKTLVAARRAHDEVIDAYRLAPAGPIREACKQALYAAGDVVNLAQDLTYIAAQKAKPEQHPDDQAVDRFAVAMKTKLAAARAKGRGGWDDPAQCTVEHLSGLLHSHVAKADPVDVANFCMMLHQRGSGIKETP